MRTSIIQFISGTTGQINQICPSPTSQQRLILDSSAGKLYWDYLGVRYQLTSDQADWSIEDPQESGYIRNKPVIPTDVSQLTDLNNNIPKDISQLTDTEHIIGTEIKNVDMSAVTVSQGIYYIALNAGRLPVFIKAPSGNTYSVQGDSITVSGTNQVTMNFTRYLAYQNATTPDASWALIFA